MPLKALSHNKLHELNAPTDTITKIHSVGTENITNLQKDQTQPVEKRPIQLKASGSNVKHKITNDIVHVQKPIETRSSTHPSPVPHTQRERIRNKLHLLVAAKQMIPQSQRERIRNKMHSTIPAQSSMIPKTEANRVSNTAPHTKIISSTMHPTAQAHAIITTVTTSHAEHREPVSHVKHVDNFSRISENVNAVISPVKLCLREEGSYLMMSCKWLSGLMADLCENDLFNNNCCEPCKPTLPVETGKVK